MNETRVGTNKYMSPEIQNGLSYTGPEADLFASAIVLFIMVAGHPPFEEATSKDRWYKSFIANRLDKFWSEASRNKPNGADFYSEDLKDLLSTMLMQKADFRLSMAEIKEHPWMRASMPSVHEIQEEFTRREATMKQTTDDAPLPDSAVDPNIFTTHAAHRGEGSDEEEEKDVERVAKQYRPEFARKTQFFSKSALEDLFNAVAQYGMNNTKEIKFSRSQFKAKMTIVKADAKVDLTVKILKVDEERHCIEFMRRSGDKFVFHELFAQAKEFFGGHVNATA